MNNIDQIQKQLDILINLILQNETSITNNCESNWSDDSINYIWTEVYSIQHDLKTNAISDQEKNIILKKISNLSIPLENKYSN